MEDLVHSEVDRSEITKNRCGFGDLLWFDHSMTSPCLRAKPRNAYFGVSGGRSWTWCGSDFHIVTLLVLCHTVAGIRTLKPNQAALSCTW